MQMQHMPRRYKEDAKIKSKYKIIIIIIITLNNKLK
jgi:hypothetical protein